MTVGRTFVAETLRMHRYEIAQLRRQWKRQVPAPMVKNRVWGMDLTGKMDAAGNVHSILGIIDHGSRLAIALQAMPNKSSCLLLKVLIAAIEQFGTPQAIRTDDEAVFNSTLFKAGLKLLGIRHQTSDLGCPWQNGRIERLFGALKQKLDQLTVPDGNMLNQALQQFSHWYNDIQPHQHLNGWTPREAWLGVDPYRQTPKTAKVYEAWEGLLTGFYLRR
jgi:transposase InsO family protein